MVRLLALFLLALSVAPPCGPCPEDLCVEERSCCPAENDATPCHCVLEEGPATVLAGASWGVTAPTSAVVPPPSSVAAATAAPSPARLPISWRPPSVILRN